MTFAKLKNQNICKWSHSQEVQTLDSWLEQVRFLVLPFLPSSDPAYWGSFFSDARPKFKILSDNHDTATPRNPKLIN